MHENKKLNVFIINLTTHLWQKQYSFEIKEKFISTIKHSVKWSKGMVYR